MLVTSFGLGFAVSWFWLFYFQGPLLPPVCALWGILPDVVLTWFIGAMCATYFLLSQIKIRSLRDKKPILAAGAAAMSLGPAFTYILPKVAAQPVDPIVAEALAAISGIAAAVFFTAWNETISISNLRRSSMMLGLAFMFASVITVLGRFGDYFWLLPLLMLFPPVSLFIMLRQVPDESSLLSDYQKVDAVRLLPLKIIIPIGILYVTGGIMIRIISIEQSYSYLFFLSYLCYALFCPLMGLILFYRENTDLRSVYRIILLLALAGFLFFCFQEDAMTIAAFVSLQGGSALLNLYSWLLFPYFARFSTRPAAVCAYGQFIMIFSVFGGNMLVGLVSTTLPGGPSIKNLAFIACLATAAAVFLFPDQKETFSGWRSQYMHEPPADEPGRRQSLPDGAKTAGAPGSLDDLPLSSREKEVLLLLLKGRSGTFISELLNISSNTVKFHTRNIYGKLSINNRQELLSLFDTKEWGGPGLGRR